MKIFVSNSSPYPIYEQVVRQIKKQIFSGELKSGDALPSIRVLAKELKISVITTRRVYEELEKEGYVNAVTGKGSFVAALDEDFLHEKRMKMIEDKLNEVIAEAKVLGITKKELKAMLEDLFEEE